MRLVIGTTIFLVALASFLMLPVIEVREPVQASTGDTTGKPKLVVLVVFDQMRGDYLQKWRPIFGDGGFKRLQDDGAWFNNCHYPYAYTLTAAGHASLVTGTTPSKHGIIGNDWYDRANAESVSSIQPLPDDIALMHGPYRRKVESVGDVLMRLLKGRVASLSIKDRSAIMLAALRAQICYWFNTSNGSFRTSPYYRPDPHSWVTKFNKLKLADQWLGKEWTRVNPNLDYVKFSGPDDVLGEGAGYNQGRTFPHPFKLGDTKDPKVNKQNFYEAVGCSPMGNELLAQFAKTAILSEKLGQGDSVDLLCLSFSSNDLIGHAWGPDSQETLDAMLRSDALVKDLLEFLDAKVGKGQYYFAVSADHGVQPLVELAKQHGKDAGRVPPELLTMRSEEFLNKHFLQPGDKAPWLEQPKRSNSWVYFNHATLAELRIEQAKAERALADWFKKQPGIQDAFTRTELMREESREASDLEKSVRLSFHPECSGDVMVVLKPYHMYSPPNLAENPDKNPSYRATHGTPHPLDTHVPLLVMGPRIAPGTRDTRVTPQAMASILAEALGVPAPKGADYPVPAGLFKK